MPRRPSVNPEELFLWFYNQGERRTYQAVADHFSLGYTTVREYADRYDWERRADETDDEVRRQTTKRLARIIANQRSINVDLLRATISRYAKRLPEQLPDGSKNPDYLSPSEIEVADLVTLLKAFELLTGGATDRVGGEVDPEQLNLAAIDAEINELDRAAVRSGRNLDA